MTPVTHQVTFTHRELALVVRGLRAVQQQLVAAPEECREIDDLRRRLATMLSNGRARTPLWPVDGSDAGAQ